MAYQKKEKKKSLPTLLGGLTSFGSVANLIKNLKSDSEFYELEVGEVLDVLLTYNDLKEKKFEYEKKKFVMIQSSSKLCIIFVYYLPVFCMYYCVYFNNFVLKSS